MAESERNGDCLDISAELAEELENAKSVDEIISQPSRSAREVGGLLEQLRDVRDQLKSALEQRDALAAKVTALQQQSQHLRSRAADVMALNQEVETLRRENESLRSRMHQRVPIQERDSLREKLVQTAQALKESHFRSEAANRRLQETKQLLETNEAKLGSVREARDLAQTQSRILSEKLVQSEYRIAELEHELERPRPSELEDAPVAPNIEESAP